MTTPVMYRRSLKRDGGDVFALFPTIPADNYGEHCNFYAHIGQHGAADFTHAVHTSKPATTDDPHVRALHGELVSRGYDDLKVIRRAPYRLHEARRATARVCP